MAESKQEEFDNLPEKKVKPHKPEKEVKKNKRNELIVVMNWLQEQYDFRFNLFAAKPECKLKISDKDYAFFDERAYNNLIMAIKFETGINIAENDFRSLIGSEKISVDYDPVNKFILDIPRWDGVDRFPEFLRQIQLLDESQREHLNKTFKKWFVMMVASILDRHVINDTCFVLSGKQGRGKTRFLESLVPKHLRHYYTYLGTFNPHDKDHLEMIGTKIQLILDEMETITRTEQGTLKSTMSTKFVTLRRAYGHAPIFLERKASFCGSINFDDFLTDTTGNRRWLPFAVHDIDVLEDYPIELLYAQARDLFRNGFKPYFDRNEIAELETHSERFQRPAPEEELILLNYAPVSNEEIKKEESGIMYLTATDVMHDLASRDEYRKMNANDTTKIRIGRVFAKLGYQQLSRKINGAPIKVWALRKVERSNVRKELGEENIQESIF